MPNVLVLPIVPDMRVAENLTISQARHLLDWLEAREIEADAVDIDGEGQWRVIWKRPRSAKIGG